MITFATIDIVIRMALAIGLGTLIGLERTWAGKTAGMRTYALITFGSSLFIIISETIMSTLSNPLIASPFVIPAAVITGIGFIGAGLIIFQENKVTGLTTAAGLWVASGVGIAIGFGLYNLAILATIAILLVFTLMKFLENIFAKYSYNIEEERNKIHQKLKELDNDSFENGQDKI